ncbi:MAG: hypothetical protein HRU28_03395 [Rhizobiales bacterium]|nr:hypothetical protein [Hyphomicrobiales bacterium]
MTEKIDSAKNVNQLIAMLEVGTCLTIDELQALTDLSRKAISRAATNLIYRGCLERIEKGCYQLTTTGIKHKQSGHKLKSGMIKPRTGVYAPKRQAFRTRLWRAMQILQKFTINELLEIARDGSEKDPINNAQRYVKALTQAEYLILLKRREPSTKLTSNGFKRYSLIRNLGHLPPVLRKAANQNEIYDRNSKEVFLCAIS